MTPRDTMSVTAPPSPPPAAPAVPTEPIDRLSVAQYHAMADAGILDKDERILSVCVQKGCSQKQEGGGLRRRGELQ
jgi:hypothetical protein